MFTNNHTRRLTFSLTFSLTHSLTYSLTHSLTHSFTYSLTHSLIHLLTHSPNHFIHYFCKGAARTPQAAAIQGFTAMASISRATGKSQKVTRKGGKRAFLAYSPPPAASPRGWPPGAGRPACHRIHQETPPKAANCGLVPAKASPSMAFH